MSTNYSDALFKSAKEGDVEGVKKYFKYFSQQSPTVTDNNGYSPLHFAARRGHIGVIQTLLDLGVPIDISGPKGSPLHFAAWRGREKAISLLLSLGANLNLEDDNGNTPLRYAINFDHLNCAVIFVQKGASLKQTMRDYPLHLAASNGHMPLLKALCEKKIPLDLQNKEKETALMSAIEEEKTEAALFLVEECLRRADLKPLSLPRASGSGPIHKAARWGDEAVISALIDNGVDVNSQNIYKWTPLHFAAEKGRTHAICLLIENGAKIDALNSDRRTPIFYSVFFGHPRATQCLLKFGADITLKDKRNETVLNHAQRKKNDQIIQCLTMSPAEIADISLPLNYSTNGGDLSIFLSPPSTTDLSAPPTLSCPSSSPPSPLLSLLQQCSLDNPSIYKRLKKGEVEPDHLLNGLISDKELADLDIRLGARKALLALSSQNQQASSLIEYDPKKIITITDKSTIYQGTYEGTPAAVKVYDRGNHRYAHQEITRAHTLRHPNIIQYFHSEVQPLSQTILVAYQLYDCDLETALQRSFLNLEKYSLYICKKMAEGLRYLHSRFRMVETTERGMIHRCLNPQNVLIRRYPTEEAQFQIFLSDFEISQTFEDQSLIFALSPTGVPGWEAPEQKKKEEKGGEGGGGERGEGEGEEGYKIGRSCDIYSLGLLFHFVLGAEYVGGGEEEEEGERILMSTNRLLPEEVEDCQFSEKLSYEERHLIGAMVEKVPADRLTIDEVLNHPLFWNGKQSEEKVSRISNVLLSQLQQHKKLEGMMVGMKEGREKGKVKREQIEIEKKLGELEGLFEREGEEGKGGRGVKGVKIVGGCEWEEVVEGDCFLRHFPKTKFPRSKKYFGSYNLLRFWRNYFSHHMESDDQHTHKQALALSPHLPEEKERRKREKEERNGKEKEKEGNRGKENEEERIEREEKIAKRFLELREEPRIFYEILVWPYILERFPEIRVRIWEYQGGGGVGGGGEQKLQSSATI